MSDRDERIIHEAISQLDVNAEGLAEGVAAKIEGGRQIHGQRAMRRFKFAPALAAVAVLLVTVTAAAAVMGGFDGFINRFNPAFGEVVVPLELYVIDNDIRMEVIGAQTFGGHIIAYISMQDVSGKNRIGRGAAFHWGLNFFMLDPDGEKMLGHYGMISGSRMLHFDEETNTAFFEISSWRGGGAVSDKISFVADEFVLDVEAYEGLPLDIDLTSLGEAYTAILPINMGSELVLTEILAPGGHFAALPFEGHWIANVGIIDGRLHVQTRHDRGISGLSFPAINLWRDGGYIHPSASIILHANENHEPVDQRLVGILPPSFLGVVFEYSSFIFDIDINALEDYALLYWGNYATKIDGDWQITAHMDYTGAQMRMWSSDVVMAGMRLENFTLTPLGLQISGELVEGAGFGGLLVTLETTKGDIELGQGTGGFGFHQSGDETLWHFTMMWMPDASIDVSAVRAVVIAGLGVEVRIEP